MSNLHLYSCRTKNVPRYECELVGIVESLDDVIAFMNAVDFTEIRIGIFKNGIEPYEEREINKFKLTHIITDNEDIEDYLRMCWNKNILSKWQVNGIYIANNKVSIWLNNQCSIKGLRGKVACTVAKNECDAASLDRNWTLGYFTFEALRRHNRVAGKDQFFSTNSEEKIERWLKKHFVLRGDGKGIFLTSNILNEDEWRVQHSCNRFVHVKVKVGVETANNIMSNFALNVCLSMFPVCRNIYLVFGYLRENDDFELGIYLSGREDIIGRRYNDEVDEDATIVGQQLKQLVAQHCDPEEVIPVVIRNAVPSIDADFLNPIYGYQTNIHI